MAGYLYDAFIEESGRWQSLKQKIKQLVLGGSMEHIFDSYCTSTFYPIDFMLVTIDVNVS